MTEKLPVLVTAAGSGVGYEVVKTLKLTGKYYIIGTDIVDYNYGIYQIDEAYLIPPVHDPEYLSILLDICISKGVRAIIAGSEAELALIATQEHIFEDNNVVVLANTADVIAICSDKFRTMSFLAKNDFPVPETTIISDIDSLPQNIVFPVILKPVKGSSGSRNTFIAQTFDEVHHLCAYLLALGVPVLMQEYIGHPTSEYTVGVLHSLTGELLGSFALHREIRSGINSMINVPNRTNRHELGDRLVISSGFSQGIADEFPEIRKKCEQIATLLGSRGPLNIQCRYMNGELYPFEINPRFSGTSYMRALCGFNEVDMLIENHLNDRDFTKQPVYKHGRLVRGLDEQLITSGQRVAKWTEV
ncbi:MAG: ATP-grasp domain-containing protein [Aggregatilineales bacterium]